MRNYYDNRPTPPVQPPKRWKGGMWEQVYARPAAPEKKKHPRRAVPRPAAGRTAGCTAACCGPDCGQAMERRRAGSAAPLDKAGAEKKTEVSQRATRFDRFLMEEMLKFPNKGTGTAYESPPVPEKNQKEVTKMKKRACSAFLALCLMLTLAVPLAAAAEPEQEPPGEEASWTVSKSKIAENLDEQYRSRITLSLPSAEETLAADVVFVLDKSSCKAETAASAEALLRQVLVGAGSDACVNVGVVVFARSAVEALPLTRASEENLQALYDAVAQRPDGLRPGTNLPSGLLAGEEMLAASATADRRKHLILISDGATYLFCKDGDYTTPYTRISAHRDGEV